MRGTTAVWQPISSRGMNSNRLAPSNQHMGKSKGANSAAAMLATESTAVIQHIPTTSPVRYAKPCYELLGVDEYTGFPSFRDNQPVSASEGLDKLDVERLWSLIWQRTATFR